MAHAAPLWVSRGSVVPRQASTSDGHPLETCQHRSMQVADGLESRGQRDRASPFLVSHHSGRPGRVVAGDRDYSNDN